jgi:flagellar basal body-associated protein FliL
MEENIIVQKITPPAQLKKYRKIILVLIITIVVVTIGILVYFLLSIKLNQHSNETAFLLKCDKIQDRQDLKGYCYANIAIREKDLSICNKIQDQDAKNYCTESIKLIKKGFLHARAII